ncbi:MAG: molybdopterin-binding oxidoreductase, partial [Chloroflexi bacterium]
PIPRNLIITPNDRFYIQQFQGISRVKAEEWQLSIGGLVENPITLTYNDILKRPRAEMMRTLECIGNPVGGNQIGNATWAGFWLNDLLDEVGIKPQAVRARFHAADGYETSVKLEWITQPGVLMAYEMNGEPLPEAHGFPLRIFMPGLYGQKMPKWITHIDFIDDDTHRGYWENKGWSDIASVKTNSQITIPTHIAHLPLTQNEITGIAYAGTRQITRVEIGVEHNDTLTWFEADEYIHGDSPQVWTQFYARWQPPESGSYTLLVRATDETGFTQTERARGLLEGSYPDGTDKIHNIVVMVG